ncbi:MAG TPA: RHS repeat-associated core domain-containing protein [Gemmatimonadaceae bacterium]|nr:RHS repeat-associated core domain-containing protein [Gemmatimonadaceae bacterium]
MVGLILVLGALVGTAMPQRALAQDPCDPFAVICPGGDRNPPTVSVLPTTMSYNGGSDSLQISVTVRWCDDVALNAGSRSIHWRGVAVTSQFNYTSSTQSGCAEARASTGVVYLQPGTNVLSASISDAAGNFGSASHTYQYTERQVALTPAGGPLILMPGTADTVHVQLTNTGPQLDTFNVFADTVLTYVLGAGDQMYPSVFANQGQVVLAPGASVDRAISVPAPASGPGHHLYVASWWGNSSDNGTLTLAEFTVNVPQVVTVSAPVGTALQPTANLTQTLPFTVFNMGSQSATLTLAATCSGTATACSVPASITVSGAGSAPVNVSYHAGATQTTGSVRLTAALNGDATNRDSATAALTVVDAARPRVATAALNPGSSVTRGLCLAIAAGPDAASECGDLRVTHGLPVVRTRNKPRAPVLLYNSQHAHPFPLVAADVAVAVGSTLPDSLVALLSVNGVVRTQRKFVGTLWTVGATRRIALDYDGLSDATGLYPYTLEVKAYRGAAVAATQVTDTLVVVNRSASPFGAGWWLAGYERLVFLANSTNLLWIGGDGSTRLYADSGLVSGTQTRVYRVQQTVDRPERLTKLSTGVYRRELKGGGYVEFRADGVETAVVNRLGQTTTFTPDASGRLSTISLPPLGTSYTFRYDQSGSAGRLIAVDAPGLTATPRTVTLGYVGTTRRVQTITDVDTSRVTFSYSATVANRIEERKDRLGHPVEFTFDAGSKLTTVRTTDGASPTPQVIQTTICPVETRSLSSCSPVPIDPSQATTTLDGPRTDSADVTTFVLDRFGAPAVITDAHGAVTRLTRGDPRWPAAVTSFERANGFVSLASYDDHGNPTLLMDLNPLGDGRVAVSQFAWDSKWDAVTEIIRPEGEIAHFAYDPTTGNLLYTEDGRGTSSRTMILYYTSGAAAGLVRSVHAPLVNGQASVDSVVYDAKGNLLQTRSPRGAWTFLTSDALGRIVRVKHPIDTVSTTLFVVDSMSYDLEDRLLRQTTAGPALNGAGADTVLVQTFYNKNGWTDSLRRSAHPDLASIGTMAQRVTYDSVGRVITEADDAGKLTTLTYDPAGNTVATRTRRGLVITMTYNALGQLTAQHLPDVHYASLREGIPKNQITVQPATENPPYPRFPNDGAGGYLIAAEDHQFGYDNLGRMIRADNPFAQVRRAYLPNGLLKTDSLRIRTVKDLSSGGNFTTHVYGLAYAYDLNGRRTAVTHPQQLAPVVSGFRRDRTTYAYDPVIGALTTVTDPLGFTFTYTYNPRSQISGLALPDGRSESYTYDPDGNLSRHLLTDPQSAIGRDVTLSYDGRGRMLSASNAVFPHDIQTVKYDGLGKVVRSRLTAQGTFVDFLTSPPSITSGTYTSSDSLATDALGHLMRVVSGDTTQTANGGFHIQSGPHGFRVFEPATGRLVKLFGESTGGRDTVWYDEDGNTVFYTQPDPSGILHDRASYYAADGTLRAADNRISPNRFTASVTFDEYRYDALGRRVLVWSRRWSSIGTNPTRGEGNLDLIRRTVWDGSSELWEMQMPGDDTLAYLESDTVTVHLATTSFDRNPYFGRVVYTHGLAVDAPLGITRVNYVDDPPDPSGSPKPLMQWAPFTIVPLWNVRRQPDMGYFAGIGVNNCQPSDPTRCVLIDFPAFYFVYGQTTGTLFYWHGTLKEQKEDKTGTFYRRNRYYDPGTGQFTQEDPVGLAGGLNLYGFAAGDPVNLSDPLGLQPCARTRSCPIDGLAVFRQVGQRVKPFQQAVEGMGKLVGLKDLADGVDDLAAGHVGRGAFRLAMVLPFDRLEGSAIRISEERLAHVLAHHVIRGIESVGKSLFREGEDVVELVRMAEKIEPVKQAVGRNYERVVDAGHVIGTDVRTGAETSVYTVITDEHNNLVTAFPGLPLRRRQP